MSCRTLLAALELTTALSLLFVWFLGQKGYNVWRIVGYQNVTASQQLMAYGAAKEHGPIIQLKQDDATVLLQYLFILGIAFLVCLGLTSIGCHLCNKVRATGATAQEDADKRGNQSRSVFYVNADSGGERDEEDSSDGELAEVCVPDEHRNKKE